MADEITQLPSSLRKDTPSLEVRPSADDLPPIERETNTMSQGELDCLKELFSFPSIFQIRLPKADETIASTHPSRVAFYKAAFHAGLHFSLHAIIRKTLYFYNTYPAQLVPNAIVVW